MRFAGKSGDIGSKQHDLDPTMCDPSSSTNRLLTLQLRWCPLTFEAILSHLPWLARSVAYPEKRQKA